MAAGILPLSADNVDHRSVLAVSARRPEGAPSVPPDLAARITAGRATVAAVTPLIAEAVAAHREVLGLVAEGAPAEPTIEEWVDAWRLAVDCGADELMGALRAVADAIGEAEIAPGSTMTGASDQFVTHEGEPSCVPTGLA